MRVLWLASSEKRMLLPRRPSPPCESQSAFIHCTVNCALLRVLLELQLATCKVSAVAAASSRKVNVAAASSVSSDECTVKCCSLCACAQQSLQQSQWVVAGFLKASRLKAMRLLRCSVLFCSGAAGVERL